MTTRICWWCVELVSCLLGEQEREVVRGDLTECGVRAGRALREVIGLVLRRQATLWFDWRPWLAVIGVALPLGTVFSHVARWWADSTAIYAFLYVNNWSWLFLENPGSRHHMIALVTGFLLNCLTLAMWSWTSGFVIGRLSRRAVWVTAALFCLIVLAGAMGTTTVARMNNFNANVFSLPFYAVVFPRLLRLFGVLLPAIWGMQRSLRHRPLPFLPTLIGAVTLVALTAWAARNLEAALVFGRGLIPPNPGVDGFVGTADDPRLWWALPFLMLWPAAYILASTSWQRLRDRRVAA